MTPTPLEQDHPTPSRIQRVIMAATRRPRVSFGLADRSRDGAGAQATDLPEVALGQVSVRIEDGVLMAFGPEGDPIPPAAFAAVAARQPELEIACGDHGPVRASRVVAVFEAQARGPLSPARGDRANCERWILAMLGLGPQPDVASATELSGERLGCELTAFGRELMITMPSGRCFLIAEATPAHRSEAAAGFSLENGQAVSVSDLVVRLRGAHQQGWSPAGAVAERAGTELALPDCAVQSTGDALVLQLPKVGPVRLAPLGSAGEAGPRVSIFRANGEHAGIADVIAELGHARSEVPLGAMSSLSGEGPSSSPPAPDAGAGDENATAAQMIGAPVPLPVGLPGGLDAERVAVLVIAGLPQQAVLSAGFDNGDGSWTLSPQDLAGLTLRLPESVSEELTLKVTALAVENFEGELAGASETIRVSLRPHEPLALAIDPAVLQVAGNGIKALVLRDLPDGASLSAGKYEPAIDGWVLLPRQLAGLTMTAPARHAAFTLTVMGVSLAAGGGEAKILTRLPIAGR